VRDTAHVASTPINFLVNLVAGLIASCYQPKKPSLGLQLLALPGA
jgi:hypothetical protein